MTCVVPRIVELISPRDDGGELLITHEDCRNIIVTGYCSSFTIRIDDIRVFLIGAEIGWNIVVSNQTTNSINVSNVDGSLNWRVGSREVLTLTLNDLLANQYSFADAIFYLLSLKQDLLVSGVNLKTINEESILGSGNLDIGRE